MVLRVPSCSELTMLPMPAQLDAYKSKDPDHPHDYGFFLTQSVTFLYLLLPLAVLLRKRLVLGAGWWRRQHVPWQTFGIMGLMDCLNALTCTIGELRLARRASQDLSRFRSRRLACLMVIFRAVP